MRSLAQAADTPDESRCLPKNLPLVTAMDYECRYPSAALALYESLAEDAFYATLEASASQDPDAARRAMLGYLDYSMIEAEEFGILTMHPEQLGAAAWNRPLEAALASTVTDQKRSFIEETMGASALEAYREMCANMHDQTSKQVPPGCWYLSIIGIVPAAQGQGIGRQMVRDVLRRTDAAGIPTYLESFAPRNKSFYERLGYQETGVNHEPFSQSMYCVMLRNPATQGDTSVEDSPVVVS